MNVKVILDGCVIEAKILEVINKGYDVNEKGETIVVDRLVTFITDTGKKFSVRNPEIV